VRDKLAGAGVAWCVADTEEQEGRFTMTAPGFAYLRLRRGGYDETALERWVKPVAAALDAGADVHCYFKHENSPTGPSDATAMLSLVNRS
jgi:uncharacterized protein YecE (DUF72 family)